MATFTRGARVEYIGDNCQVTLQHYKDWFGIKAGDRGKITRAFSNGWLRVKFDTSVKNIPMRALNLRFVESGEKPCVKANDLVHQFGALDVTTVSDKPEIVWWRQRLDLGPNFNLSSLLE